MKHVAAALGITLGLVFVAWSVYLDVYPDETLRKLFNWASRPFAIPARPQVM